MESHYGSVGEFAIALDTSIAQASQLINGYRLPGNKLQSKLRSLGCDIEWLMTGNKKEELEHLDNTIYRIPIFEYIKAGGKTMVLREEPAEYLHTTTKDKTLYGVRVKGTSMEPTIMEGEIVIASKTAQVKEKDVCIIMFEDGETCLRRIYFHDHSCTLASDNKDYPPQVYKKKEIKTINKVVERITKF